MIRKMQDLILFYLDGFLSRNSFVVFLDSLFLKDGTVGISWREHLGDQRW